MNQAEKSPAPAGPVKKADSGQTRLVLTAIAWCLCLAIVGGVIFRIHPHSLTGFGYYLGFWLLFILLFDRRETKDFVSAYLVNAALTALYVLVQVHYYPDSHGCTSPLGAQTDDSFFFSLVADEIPEGLDTRPGYFLYHYGFSTLVRLVTPFRVDHPLDVLFFLSGVAGVVCVYAQQLAIQLTSSVRAGRTAYFLSLFCPMMLMNGGAVFVRDTLVAGLFVLSLCCIHRKRFLAFGCGVALQFVIRPGTALMILALLGFMLAENVGSVLRTRARRLGFCVAVGVLAMAVAVGYFERDWLEHELERNGVVLGELRREGQEETLAAGFGKGAFTAIQQQALPLRLTLSTAFMYLSPFLNFNNLRTPDGFDTRILLLNGLYPVWILPAYAWIFAAWFAKSGDRAALRRWILMIGVACFFIGAFSLQSRHRVIIQPVFYAIAAAGAHLGSSTAKVAGFGLAGLWIVAQLAYLCFF